MFQSRLYSTALLVDIAIHLDKTPLVFVSASGSGYYPDSDQWVDENGTKGTGFIADLTEAWEEALIPLQQKNVRTVIMRTGVILDKEHGALARMLPFFKWGLGAAVGNGKQFLSWIHASDAAAGYSFALQENQMQGVFNLSTNYPVSNKEFSARLAETLGKPFFLPNIPAFVLNVLFGKMAQLVLRSNRMASKKLIDSGFQFMYPNLGEALRDVFQTKL